MRTAYLDNNATTAVAPEVREAMEAYFTEEYFNPSSAYDRASPAAQAIKRGREVLARFGGWTPPAEAAASVPPAGAAGAPQTEAIPKELTQATILLGRQALRQVDPDYFPLAVASYALGGGSASRQRSNALGHRGAKAQPAGSAARSGGWPSMAVSRCRPSLMRGIELSSALV